jgi:hypothetical protein
MTTSEERAWLKTLTTQELIDLLQERGRKALESAKALKFQTEAGRAAQQKHVETLSELVRTAERIEVSALIEYGAEHLSRPRDEKPRG